MQQFSLAAATSGQVNDNGPYLNPNLQQSPALPKPRDLSANTIHQHKVPSTFLLFPGLMLQHGRLAVMSQPTE